MALLGLYQPASRKSIPCHPYLKDTDLKVLPTAPVVGLGEEHYWALAFKYREEPPSLVPCAVEPGWQEEEEILSELM